MTRETLGERFAALQYSSMERIAMRWPERVGRALFQAYGWAMYRAVPAARATVAENLSHVLGRPAQSELVQEAVREAFRLYARYWYDTFHVRVMPPDEVTRTFHMEDQRRLDEALERGNGAILALPHLGNWDVAGHYICLNGYRMVAVAERLAARRVYELFLRHRQELGMKIISIDPAAAGTEAESASRVGPQLAQLLADNWLVALVADRDLTGRGVEVEMFGARRRLPAGPALLSLSTGSPLMVCPVYTTETGWWCRIGEPLSIERSGDTRTDVTRLTERLAREFERLIAAKPTDWHMFQRAWADGSGSAADVSAAAIQPA